MAFSALYFQPSTGGQFLLAAATFMLLGMISLWVSLWLNQRATKHAPGRGDLPGRPYTLAPSQPFVRLNSANWIALLLGIVYLAVVAEISGKLHHSPSFADVSHHLQFALFVNGIVFITWGLGAGRIKSNSPVGTANNVFSPPLRVRGGGWGEGLSFWLILPIILLAFALRFWELGDAVHHFVDEIFFSTAVANSWLAPDYNVSLLAPFGSITAFPWLYPYLQAGGVAIFGRDLEGLRALSAVLGTLTVPALYLLAKALFDRKTALIAALILATFPPHVNFSRIGINNIADPLFGTLALAFLARGLKFNRRMDFAIGGASLGLSQYFYEGGRFLFIFLPCLWLIWFIVMSTAKGSNPRLNRKNGKRTEGAEKPETLIGTFATSHFRETTTLSPFSGLGFWVARRLNVWRRKRATSAPRQAGLRREVRTGIVTFLLAAVLVAAPVYYVLYALHWPLAARMDIVGVGGSYWLRAVSIGGGQSLDQHLFMPLLTFVFMPEQAAYYDGDHPMILEIFVPLFLLGAAYTLWRWRGPGMLLLLWVLLTAAGNSLMTYAAIYARYVVVFPALALLMALGVRYVMPLILPSRINARLGTALMVIAVVATAAVQTVYYFGPHLDLYNQRLRARADEEDALFRSVPFPPGTRIHLVTEQPLDAPYVYGVLGYLADHLSVDIITPDMVTPDYLLGLSRRIDHAFYVEPKDTLTPQTLAQYFTVQPPAYSPFNVPQDRQYVLYYVAGLWSPGR
jgi:hypothetical protein